MKVKSLLVIMVMVSMALIFTPTANATCTSTGYVNIVSYTGNSSTCYYYIAPQAFFGPPPYLMYFTTNNATFISCLNAALARGCRINITGDATTCPTSGAVRNGGQIISYTISVNG